MDLETDNNLRFRHLDWEKVKKFYYVAKFGRFSHAAKFLNTSQPSLSRQVIQLEEHLGYPLFIRKSAGLQLTRKGGEFFRLVEHFFIGMKGFTHHHAVMSHNGRKRTIRISTTHALIAYVLSDLILYYNKEHPHLIFELISEDHLIDVVINDVDIAIRPYDPQAREVQQESLFTLEKRLYASSGYLEEYGEPQTVEDLKNHRIIAPARPDEYPYSKLNWILTLGLPDGEFHEPVFTSNSIECLIKMGKASMGIVGSYKEMEIVRNANLKNILPHVKLQEEEAFLLYPNYLKEDQEIIRVKEYLKEKLSPKTEI